VTILKSKPTGFTVLIGNLEKKAKKYHNPENHRYLAGIVSEGMMNLEDVWRK
jgi:hypothetical protein